MILMPIIDVANHQEGDDEGNGKNIDGNNGGGDLDDDIDRDTDNTDDVQNGSYSAKKNLFFISNDFFSY